VQAGEKLVDRLLGFKLSYDPRQRRSIMVDLRVLHPLLPSLIAEERQHLSEGELLTMDHVRERPSLPILQKLFTRDDAAGHFCPLALGHPCCRY
jgi:hypothetical protein